MGEIKRRQMGRKAVRHLGFAARLAKRLQLDHHQEKQFSVHSSRGKLHITIGKFQPSLDGGGRPVRVEGIIKLRGMEYYLKVHNKNGSGKAAHDDEVSLFDRSAGEYLCGTLSKQVYETLVPLIELGVEEMLED